jgi:hypothetical protein
VLAGLVTMTEVNTGVVDLLDLMKLNALLDAREAAEAAASKKGRT